MSRLLQVAELPGSDIDLGQARHIPAASTGTIDRLSIGRPGRTVILNIALMGRQMLDFTFGHVDGINVLIEVGFHPISQDPPVIKRPAESKIIAARTFVKKARFGEPGCVSARSYLLNIDVESAWVLAIGAESDLLTVM